MANPTLLNVKNLKKYFPVKKANLFAKQTYLQAVDDICLTLEAGKTLGIVGESGCGKSTLAKTIACLYKSDHGQILFKNQNIAALSQKKLKPFRPKVQYVFQDPYESLNPRHTIGESLEEPFIIHTELGKQQRQNKVENLLQRVGLPANSVSKYPHEFSGGQRQRIGIARAIALEPELLICDEPVSALDVSVQSQILNLLIELQRDLNIAILFIAHDLAVVKHISDDIAVMYLGQIIEQAPADELFQHAKHPYTQFLLDAIPTADPTIKKTKRRIKGELPSPVNPPKGCRFQSRCPFVKETCSQSVTLTSIGKTQSHEVACHFPEESSEQWRTISP